MFSAVKNLLVTEPEAFRDGCLFEESLPLVRESADHFLTLIENLRMNLAKRRGQSGESWPLANAFDSRDAL
jgi:hypothetical protein